MTEKRTTLEIIAPTINEAIEEGLTKLGVKEDAVEIEVLDEGSNGLFGLGNRQSRVRLTIKGEGEAEFKGDSYLEELSQPEDETFESQDEIEAALLESEDQLL